GGLFALESIKQQNLCLGKPCKNSVYSLAVYAPSPSFQLQTLQHMPTSEVAGMNRKLYTEAS
ncbi:MAG TPA: hypothetical protein DCW57_02180, partial [Planctomycetaceae bacterium]|nr:hypothetical protein [Planctomycetaceae bacterium]